MLLIIAAIFLTEFCGIFGVVGCRAGSTPWQVAVAVVTDQRQGAEAGVVGIESNPFMSKTTVHTLLKGNGKQLVLTDSLSNPVSSP